MKIETIKEKGFALSIISFPIMLLTGFLMHPHLLKFEALQTFDQLVGRFHNQPVYHIGHLIVMFIVPFIIIAMISIMNVLLGRMKCSSTICPIYDTKKDRHFKCLKPCG
jgi:hypothetical protein